MHELTLLDHLLLLVLRKGPDLLEQWGRTQ